MSSRDKRNLQRQNQSSFSVSASRQDIYVGPLPRPDLLKQFDEIVPGAAERIITQFEKQSDHRRNLENIAIKHDRFISTLGLFCGFVIAMSAISGGVYAATLGKDLFGSILSGTGLVGLVSVFIYGSQSKRKHLQERGG